MGNIFSGSNMFDSNGNPIYGGNSTGGQIFTATTSTNPNGYSAFMASVGTDMPIGAHKYNCESCGHLNIHEDDKDSYCHLCNEKHEC